MLRFEERHTRGGFVRWIVYVTFKKFKFEDVINAI